MAGKAHDKVFESSARSTGDIAGVFEHDGETGYFYLYAPQAPDRHKVFSALHVMSGRQSFDGVVVEVRWDAAESVVGLFIGRELWAAFDTSTGAGFTGDYTVGVRPDLPSRIRAALLEREAR